jgi:hypothetical protein
MSLQQVSTTPGSSASGGIIPTPDCNVGLLYSTPNTRHPQNMLLPNDSDNLERKPQLQNDVGLCLSSRAIFKKVKNYKQFIFCSKVN